MKSWINAPFLVAAVDVFVSDWFNLGVFCFRFCIYSVMIWWFWTPYEFFQFIWVLFFEIVLPCSYMLKYGWFWFPNFPFDMSFLLVSWWDDFGLDCLTTYLLCAVSGFLLIWLTREYAGHGPTLYYLITMSFYILSCKCYEVIVSESLHTFDLLFEGDDPAYRYWSFVRFFLVPTPLLIPLDLFLVCMSSIVSLANILTFENFCCDFEFVFSAATIARELMSSMVLKSCVFY